MGACETKDRRAGHHHLHKDKKKKKNPNNKFQPEPYFNQKLDQNQLEITPQQKGVPSHKNTMRPDVDNHTLPGQESQKEDFQSEKFLFPNETKSNTRATDQNLNIRRVSKQKYHSMCLEGQQDDKLKEEQYSLSKSAREKPSEIVCQKKPLSIVQEQDSPSVPPQAQQYANSFFHVNDLGISTNPKTQMPQEKSRLKNQEEIRKSEVPQSRVGPQVQRYGNQTIGKSTVAYPSLPYLQGYSNIKGTYAV